MREKDFLYYRWRLYQALLSYVEPLQLHRSRGHPSVFALYTVLKRAHLEEIVEDVEVALENLGKDRKICSELASMPKRFKLVVGNDGEGFSYSISTDVMYVRPRSLLYVVNKATHLCVALFFRNTISKEVCKVFLPC